MEFLIFLLQNGILSQVINDIIIYLILVYPPYIEGIANYFPYSIMKKPKDANKKHDRIIGKLN